MLALIIKTLHKKACLLARGGNVAPAIDSLRQWAGKAGCFDCDAVHKDQDFDPIRADPAFVAFMAEMGCAPPAEPPEPQAA
ncbi:hypothetical protein [Sphingomonas sp.]|uniref:TPR end-of-group domain-containing protein n=1 Tax=Sphingomonas sp. TaxID=28214 RepID=UPI0025D8F192|nr:hypothetical protein [Sphingomonas sp.]